jgi:hypothetical protein
MQNGNKNTDRWLLNAFITGLFFLFVLASVTGDSREKRAFQTGNLYTEVSLTVLDAALPNSPADPPDFSNSWIISDHGNLLGQAPAIHLSDNYTDLFRIQYGYCHQTYLNIRSNITFYLIPVRNSCSVKEDYPATS